MIEITEQDGELLIDGKPVDYQAPWKVEDAIRQLRAEIEDYRDQFAGLCHTLSVGSEGRPEMTANDWRKRVDDGINWLTSPMIKRYETAETECDKLRADIAERDARIADMTNCALKNIPADWRPGYAWTDDCAMNVLSEYVVEIQTKCERAEAELAQLRAQEPVAWMWNDMIGIPHTHISPTRPTWPDAGASSAMSVAINVRPLYAEPMPAKCAQQKQARAQES